MPVRKDTGSGSDSAQLNPIQTSVGNAVEASKRYLLAIQAADGHWVGELEGDTILESEYVLDDALPRAGPGEERVRKAAEYLRRKQLTDRRLGDLRGRSRRGERLGQGLLRPEAHGRRPARRTWRAPARRSCRSAASRPATPSRGSISRSSASATWDDCPGGAAGDRAPARLGSSSTSTRCPPGRAASSCRCRSSGQPKPFCPVPDRAAIPELHVPTDGGARSAEPARAVLARLLHADRPLRSSSPRRRASAAPHARPRGRAEAWIHERLAKSDGLGAIFPPIINTIIAFRCLGYAPRRPAPRRRRSASSRSSRSRTARRSASSPASRRSGTPRSRSRRSPTSGLPADDPALAHGGPVAARPRGQQAGDWKKAGPARGAGRLVLRVRQRVLPGHRRHGRGAHRALARALSRRRRRPRRGRARSPAARPGCSRCRTTTAAGARSTRTATTRS